MLSRWSSRDAAEAALVYLSHPNAKRVEALVSEPPAERGRGAVTSPMLVVALANARARRRPPRAARAAVHDGLKDANSASELLESFLGQPVDPADISALRALHRAVVGVVDALIGARHRL